MKMYIKNKKFIPRDFIEKVNSKSQENNNKLIVILLIINIFIIPSSIERLKSIFDNTKTAPVIKTINGNKDINKEKIKKVLNIINDNINNIKIQNNSGMIEFNSIEEVYKLEEENIININSLRFNTQNSFDAEVGL